MFVKKTCAHCKLEKNLTAFNKSKKTNDGFSFYCRPCNKIFCRRTYILRKQFATHESFLKARNYNLIRMFGITSCQYDKILLSQDGVCAICKKPETVKYREKIRFLAVDHCHKTKKVRGLLCKACNNGLGNFNDDYELLSKASAYLKTQQS